DELVRGALCLGRLGEPGRPKDPGGQAQDVLVVEGGRADECPREGRADPRVEDRAELARPSPGFLAPDAPPHALTGCPTSKKLNHCVGFSATICSSMPTHAASASSSPPRAVFRSGSTLKT